MKKYTLYYGTNNVAKISFMKDSLEELPIDIVGINDIENIDHQIIENGKDPLENAKIKAWHYYKQIGKPVFSADSGLFFENVEDVEQPGTNIRRINNKKLTDNEMVNYYSKLAEKYGGELIGYYKNGIYVIINEQTVLEYDGICSEKFIISSKPHHIINEGFPLDSLSKELKSGEYYYDLDETKYENDTPNEFKIVFEDVIKKMDE